MLRLQILVYSEPAAATTETALFRSTRFGLREGLQVRVDPDSSSFNPPGYSFRAIMVRSPHARDQAVRSSVSERARFFLITKALQRQDRSEDLFLNRW